MINKYFVRIKNLEKQIRFRSIHSISVPTVNKSGLKKNLRFKEDGRYYWHWDPRFVTDADTRREERDPDRLIAAAKRLTCPTLLVRGGSSDLVTEARAKEFQEYTPHAEFVDVSGAGHMVAGDKNDHFKDSVIGFLERV